MKQQERKEENSEVYRSKCECWRGCRRERIEGETRNIKQGLSRREKGTGSERLGRGQRLAEGGDKVELWLALGVTSEARTFMRVEEGGG